MIVIGITGGIGTGKSMVCSIFNTLGIPVYDADTNAKQIIVDDAEVKSAIIKLFGDDAYYPDGTYNKAYVASIVFNDKLKLERLNAIVHPKVIQRGNLWANANSHHPYLLREAALMFESGSYIYNQFNILVESPIELRIKRICSRDKCSKEEAIKRINAQWSDEERRKYSDLIIYNNEEKSLIQQVYQIHQNLLFNNDPR
jgi:dephospho-CoA kinase